MSEQPVITTRSGTAILLYHLILGQKFQSSTFLMRPVVIIGSVKILKKKQKATNSIQFFKKVQNTVDSCILKFYALFFVISILDCITSTLKSLRYTVKHESALLLFILNAQKRSAFRVSKYPSAFRLN